MKTYQTYQTGSRQAETKLRVAEQQRSKLEVANAPPEKLARSKKYKLMEKEVNKVGKKNKDRISESIRPYFSILFSVKLYLFLFVPLLLSLFLFFFSMTLARSSSTSRRASIDFHHVLFVWRIRELRALLGICIP